MNKMSASKSTGRTWALLGVLFLLVVVGILMSTGGREAKRSGGTDDAEARSELYPVSNFTHGHGLAVDGADSKKLFIATHHGLFVLLNDRDLYRVGRQEDDYMGFIAHPADPRAFFSSGHPSGGGNLGFQRSSDGGKTWSRVSDGLNGPVDFHAMTVSPADPAVVYGWYRGELQRSSDGGRSWQAFPTGFVVVALAADPKDPDVVYAASPQRGLMISRSGGKDWSALLSDYDGGQAATISVDPTDALRLFASTEKLGAVRSIDGGTSWKKFEVEFDGTVLHFAFDNRKPGTIYVLTHNNVLYKTTDGGDTWTMIR